MKNFYRYLKLVTNTSINFLDNNTASRKEINQIIESLKNNKSLGRYQKPVKNISYGLKTLKRKKKISKLVKKYMNKKMWHKIAISIIYSECKNH